MGKSGKVERAVGVADLKRNFSDYLDRVLHRRERVLVRRRGKGVAALVPIDEVPVNEAVRGQGLLAAAGAWERHREIDAMVRSIYRARRRAKDRPVDL